MKAFAGLLVSLLLPACGGVAERQPEQTSLPAQESPSPAQTVDAPTPGAGVPATVDPPAPRDVPEFHGAGNVGASGGSGATVCTQIGCNSGFEVVLDKSSPWRAGEYRLRLLEEGREAIACSVIIPTGSSTQLVDNCPDDSLELVGDGGAAQAALASVWLFTTADSVELELAFGEQPLATAQYVPNWSESRPNGPGCGPVCLSAAPETLAFE